jgi:hypothetical protein
MDLFGNLFGTAQPSTGNPLAPAPPQSNFWDGLLSGAVRGVEQNFSTSSAGTGLQAFLTQGQSQVSAMNLFGNPLILIGVVLVIGFVAVKAFK